MPDFPKPKIVVSKCLGFAPCRWNGVMINDPFVEKLAEFVKFIPVCPEMEIGLGVPRKPVRLVENNKQIRLVQPDSGLDVTDPMAKFIDSFLNELTDVDGFLLKSRSPSCGPNDVRIYFGAQKGAGARKGAGMFGEAVQKLFSQSAIEHEGRTRNFNLREHFLTKLFTLTSFKFVRIDNSVGSLVRFHSLNKFLLMAYHQSGLKTLGHIAANPDNLPAGKLIEVYGKQLFKSLSKSPANSSNINTMMHVAGFFKKQLKTSEKMYFYDLLDAYRQKRLPLSALQSLLRSWAVRFENDYILNQTYFRPYPLKLLEVLDSGKGRDL